MSSHRTLTPADEHTGVALRLEAVTLTDRITVFPAGLTELPAGASSGQLLCRLPGEATVTCTLEDDRGNTYVGQSGVGWQVQQPPASTVIFAVAQPRPGR